MKQLITDYSFDASARTVTLASISKVYMDRLLLITNVTHNVGIYNFMVPGKGGSVNSTNVVTLDFDTTWMADTDDLQIFYDAQYGDPATDRQAVGNAMSKFSDGFSDDTVAQPSTAVWDTVNDGSAHIVNVGGNSFGSKYLRISLSPFVDDSEVKLTSDESFRFPMELGFGVSMSQRIVGQEVFFGAVGVSDSNSVVTANTIADKTITGSTISITTNVGTVTLTDHGLNGGDRIAIYGCLESRLNVAPVIVTVLTKDTFTVPITLANGTYTCTGGMVRFLDPARFVKNYAGLLIENATVTNASLVARRNGNKFRLLNSTIATTTATQANTSPFTDAFNSASNNEIYLTMDEVNYRSYAQDSVATMSGLGKFTQGNPDEKVAYKIQLRARNLIGMTKPVGRITSIAKTGTTTATVTTDIDHGLTTSDFVQIYGVRDQTNFPNLTAQTAVASVPTSTTFTVVIGSASTNTSAGGTVFKNQGSVLAPGAFAQVVQSVSRTSNVMTFIGSGTWATPLPGEYVQVWGMEGSAAQYDGAYKVLRVSTTTLEVESTGADFGSISTGGAVMRRTDVRFHFVKVLDYTRLMAEITGGRGNTTDINNSVPISITSGGVVQSTGISTTQWSAAGWGGFLVADVASAALTTTTTTATISPGSNVNIGTYTHSFNVIVTAVSGTNPTLDVGVEESPDNGTNWFRIYDFERITATGAYSSPPIRATYGTRYRYVQTVGGSTPSFTRSVNRIQFSHNGQVFNRFIDRTININSLNSTTPSYLVEGATTHELVVSVGAITTTAPQFQFEGSESGVTGEWYNIGSPLTAVASSTVRLVYTNELPKFVRARVSTAGSGATANYVAIKAIGP
jgi:hypothetical protein